MHNAQCTEYMQCVLIIVDNQKYCTGNAKERNLKASLCQGWAGVRYTDTLHGSEYGETRQRHIIRRYAASGR